MTLTSNTLLRRPMRRLLLTGLAACSFLLMSLASATSAHASGTVDAKASPNEFVEEVGHRALEAVRHDAAAKRGDIARINELIDQYLLPYVNFEKTTRLAAGQHWRKATPQQREALVTAFKGTLVRTYGGALANVEKISALKILPFRGDLNANDVVVRSTFLQNNGPAIGVDYRLEKSASGWRIYDLSVEGIWLIQTYRNQFAQQVNQNGMDGLIAALNSKNQ